MASSSLRERWASIPQALRAQVENVMSSMPRTTLHDCPIAEALPYATTDAIATYLIYEPLYDQIIDAGLESVLEMDMAVIPLCDHIQRTGMLIDKRHFADVSVDLGSRIANLDKAMFSQVGHIFNPDSPDQISELLYDELQLHHQLKSPKRTSTGRFKADAKALKSLKDAHPVVPLLLERREYSKLKGSFVDKLPLLAGPDGRVRTSIRITRVPSGRFSSAKPNLQQIPTKNEVAKLVRKGFIVPPQYYMCSIDLSAIEMRTAAHLSRDPLMMELLRDPSKDIHYETAARIFGRKIVDDPDPKVRYQFIDKMNERDPCKRVGFLILYGGTAAGLSEVLIAAGLTQWTEPECEKLMKSWFEVYNGVYEWVVDNQSYARMNGFVRDGFGRRIWVPQVRSSQSNVREEGLRLAQNAPVQATAAGVLKLASAKVWQVLKQMWAEGKQIKCIMSIHDELLFEHHQSLQDEVRARILPCFEQAAELVVPIRAGIAWAEDWGSVEK